MSNQRFVLRPVPNAETASPPRFALFALGFRPFYLLAALLAALSAPVWVAQYVGVLPAGGPIAGLAWHMHEMVFGFAVAVIAGFLFTAGRNWTNQPTPTGWTLAGLAALWLAARILAVTGPAPAAAWVDFLFLPLVAWFLWRALHAAGNRRNYFFVALLAALAALNLAFWFAAFGVVPVPPLVPVKAALYVIVAIVAIMGGRVIPMFTQNALPAARVRRHARLDRWAIGMLAAALALDVLAASAWLLAPVALAAAALHGARLATWDPVATRSSPILWILHVSYAWIPAGLALLALAALTPAVHEVYAIHAFGIGAIGGMIIGMITRTALGHTGRPLVAGLAETFAYGLVQAAAFTRVAVGLAAPSLYGQTLALSALFWAAGFAIYAVAYFPILTRPRADGRPG
ncbi:MAG: NnrS family protein [Burkholderiales bacterium]|nr:NnrS family protein [Burkholderiales bacterium]